MKILLIISIMFPLISIHCAADDTPSFEEHFNLLCETTIEFEKAIDLHGAFARFWLDRDLSDANLRLERAYLKFLEESPSGEMTPELAASKVKWQMRTWVRIYSLFHERLSADNKKRLESLFWNYACAKSTIARTNLKYIWCIQGSENHDIMDLSNAFLSIQAVKDHADYRERTLPDGYTLSEHYEAWNRYYKEYCVTRAANGQFAEVGSPTYGKYFMPELTNIADFAEDPELRERMTVLLNLTWADWAIDQLNGIRGGGKTRSYLNHYSFRGISDSWYHMGRIIFDMPGWWDGTKISNHDIHGFPFIIGSSKYRVPAAIRSLAMNLDERGEYEYISLRPGKLTDAPIETDDLPEGTYQMDGQDPHLIRYSYCTPDYIMGGFMDDPTLNYAAISTQNRWHGIVFATDVNARIFPQCEVVKKNSNYSQFLSVQHKNVMLLRRNPEGKDVGTMRIFFSAGMKSRIREIDDRFFIEEDNAFVAVMPLSATNPLQPSKTKWDDGSWLRVEEEPSVIVFVTGRRPHFSDLRAFEDYVSKHQVTSDGKEFSCRFKDPDGNETVLVLPVDGVRVSQINGRPVDLSPERTFNSPYFYSEGRTGVATIQFKGETLTVDLSGGF